jgi:hypothetical protein
MAAQRMERLWHSTKRRSRTVCWAAMADGGGLFEPAVAKAAGPRFHNFNLGGKNTMLSPFLQRDFEYEAGEGL